MKKIEAPLNLHLGGSHLQFSHTLPLPPGDRDPLSTLATIIDEKHTISTPYSWGNRGKEEFNETVVQFNFDLEETREELNGFSYPVLEESPPPFLALGNLLSKLNSLPSPQSLEILEVGSKGKIVSFSSSSQKSWEEGAEEKEKDDYLLVAVVMGEVVLSPVPGNSRKGEKGKGKEYLLPRNSYLLVSGSSIDLNFSLNPLSDFHPYLMIYRFHCDECSKLNYTYWDGLVPSSLIQRIVTVLLSLNLHYEGTILTLDDPKIPPSLLELYKLLQPYHGGKMTYVDIGKERDVEVNQSTNGFLYVALADGNLSFASFSDKREAEKEEEFKVVKGGVISVSKTPNNYLNLLKIHGDEYSLLFY